MLRPAARTALLLAAILVASPAVAQTAPTTTEAPTFEFRGGRWIPTAAPDKPIPRDPDLDRAEDLLSRGGWKAARVVLLRWFKTHDRAAPLRDRATFLLAEVYFTSGNRILSFYHFDEVMDLYPESRLYPAALARQYDIAEAYLQGYRRRVFKIPLLGAQDEAIEMLFRIQGRVPGSPMAEKALLRTSDYYYDTRQYDLAADAYGAFLKNYPRSPEVATVRLKRAYSALAQYRGSRFDATNLIDAREQFSDLTLAEPDLAAQQKLPEMVTRIDAALAQKLLQTGEFYARTHEPRAAAYTYHVLEKQFPDSPQAATARERLAKLPPEAVTQGALSTRPDDEIPPVTPLPPTRPITVPPTTR